MSASPTQEAPKLIQPNSFNLFFLSIVHFHIQKADIFLTCSLCMMFVMWKHVFNRVFHSGQIGTVKTMASQRGVW